MSERRQIIIIRGGETFSKREDYYEYLRTVKLDPYQEKKNWRDWIAWALSETHDVLTPLMPCKQNAEYEPWKIWFERHLSFITDPNPIFIGHSLGTTFLLKWLSENKYPGKIFQLHLVAPFVSDEVPMKLESLSTFKFDLSETNTLTDSCQEIHIWHSEDDMVVPYRNTELLKENLPSAVVHTFTDRQHFNQPAFIELLQHIKESI